MRLKKGIHEMFKDEKKWQDVFMGIRSQQRGVTDGRVVRQAYVGGGDSHLYVCPLWDGVFLWANEIHDSYLNDSEYDLNRLNYAVLNLCIAGRCEVSADEQTYIYVTPGLININNLNLQNGYRYPGSLYEGVEIAFDLDLLAGGAPPELISFGLDPDFLCGLLREHNGNYMAAMTDEAKRQTEVLYHALKAGDLERSDYRFLTVSLLYALKHGATTRSKDRLLVTRGQRLIANEVEQLLVKDLRTRYTVEELAGQYDISPSALKKYFEMVFGMPISHYLRKKRMEKAVCLLTETGHSIGEIASACGYESQSKFGIAFKAYSGFSPLEYKRIYGKRKGG